MAEKDDGYAVQIVNCNEDNTFRLNEEALKAILLQDDIKDKHVCVVSIAGAFRQGKSFLLNFLLRYLHLKCEREENVIDWLDSSHGLLKGFSWKSGSKKHTLGIVMWSKIFIRKLPSGEEVAVILLDTQGAFDNDSTYNDCATIFALSTLISSVQIYNLMQNIKQDDLAHLECFAGFGNCVKGDEFPFQSLLFLVRDWVWSEESEYGMSGGDRKLAEVLNVDGNVREEVRSRRKNIRDLFKKIKCCLMPKPGTSVSESTSFNGNIEEIEEEFLEQIEKLVPLLLDSRNLEIKRINGDKITASILYEYIVSYMTIFRSSEMPQIESMYRATAEANHKTVVYESLAVYKQLMDKASGEDDNALNDKELETAYFHARAKAMSHYQDKRKIGNTRISKKFETELKEQIVEKFKEYKSTNEIKQRENDLKVESRHKDIVSSSIEMYKKRMAEIVNSKENQYDRLQNQAEKQVLEFFNQQTENSEMELKRTCFEKLQSTLKEMSAEYREKNSLIQQVGSAEDEKKLRIVFEKIKTAHKKYMEDFIGNGVVDEVKLKKVHEQRRFELLKYFEQECVKYSQELKTKLLEELKKIFDDLFVIYGEKNKTNYLSEINYLYTVQEETEAKYRYKMEENFGEENCHFDPAELDELHEDAKEHAYRYFSERIKSHNNLSELKQQLDEKLNRIYHEFQGINERNRQGNLQKIKEQQEKISEELESIYRNHMNGLFETKSGSYFHESELENQHSKIKNEILNSYRDKIDSINARITSESEGFGDRLNDLFNEYKKKNDVMRDKHLANADKEYFLICEKAKSIYMRFINIIINLLTKLTANSEVFERRHQSALSAALEYYQKEETTRGINEKSSFYKDKLLQDLQKFYTVHQEKLSNCNSKQCDRINEKESEKALNYSQTFYRRQMREILNTNKFLSEDSLVAESNKRRAEAMSWYNNKVQEFGVDVADKNVRLLEKALDNSSSEFIQLNDMRRDYERLVAENTCLSALLEARNFHRLLVDNLKNNDNTVGGTDFDRSILDFKKSVLDDFDSKKCDTFDDIAVKYKKQLVEFLEKNRVFKVKNDMED